MYRKARSWMRLAGAYAILLIASHTAEVMHPRSRLPPGIRMTLVHAVDQGRIQARSILLAYRDTAPGAAGVPVVLVHGSPGSSEVLEPLANLLSPRFRVIVPDLPGFGASTRDLPDYSFRTHGRYLIELLDALHIERAQLVGFSMGGGVVLSVVDLAPRRVASVVMLSAIGVQEHELTGDYRLNHVLHRAQLGALWLLTKGFPHFGLFRQTPFTLEYARNFYDSDQRPLRSILENYRGPMLILHGTRDRNVPIAAAREHHGIVPQSKTIEFNENHFMAFQHPSVFLGPLVQFLSDLR